MLIFINISAFPPQLSLCVRVHDKFSGIFNVIFLFSKSYSQTVHKKGGDPDTDKNNHRESQVGDERGISIDPRDRKSISLTSAKQGGLFGDFLQMLFPSHLLLYLAAGKGKFQLSSKFTSFP